MTPFSQADANFSGLAHEAAKRLVYPKIFPGHEYRFEENTLMRESDMGKILDGRMGIDRVAYVRPRSMHLRGWFPFTIQERFRRPSYRGYSDLTITEWNHASGTPSELYKLFANLFIYGYYDPDSDKFGDCVCVSVTKMLFFLLRAEKGEDFLVRMNKKHQSFIAVEFRLLKERGCILYHQGERPPRMVRLALRQGELSPA